MPGIAEEIDKLERLRRNGTLSEEEFRLAKQRVIAGDDRAPAANDDELARRWAFFLHLSILAGFALPILGLIVPICIWQIKKDEFPSLDRHGKNALNWILSVVIYGSAGALLAFVFVFVGFAILFALAVCGVAFPIMAAIRANDGRFWKYPLSIPFLSVDA